MKLFLPILVLLFAISAQVYVSYRIWHILPVAKIFKTGATVLYNAALMSMFVFFLSHRFETIIGNFAFNKFIYEVGTTTLFVLLYLFMLFLLTDLLRLIHVLPKDIVSDSKVGSLAITGIMLAIFIGSNIHYHHKYRETVDLTSSKPLPKPLKIVMLSDLHLGYHNERSEFAKWVDIINGENPDIVMIGGDIVDFDVVPLLEQNVAEEFHRIKAPIYACLGNHEFIGGKDKALSFYKSAGINLLVDDYADLPEYGLRIIGRDDFSNRKRKSIPEIIGTQSTDSLYTILLNHQPFYLNDSEESGVDFQFSGHTHMGQMFPINLIIKGMYECGYGEWQRGNTRYYVSSGMGIWGGKYRNFSQSEYVVVNLTNTDQRD